VYTAVYLSLPACLDGGNGFGLRSGLKSAHKDAQKLAATMSHTCDLAEKVSSKVRLLDLAKVERKHVN
jgi:hypothetical protein